MNAITIEESMASIREANKPCDASVLLSIVVSIASHIAKNPMEIQDKYATLDWVIEHWWHKKNKFPGYSYDSYCTYTWGDACFNCGAFSPSNSNTLRNHCVTCRAFVLWNPTWFISSISVKTGVHPSWIEYFLIRYIGARNGPATTTP